MFDRVKPIEEIEGLRESEWIEMLNQVFMSRIPKIGQSIE